MFEFEYNGEPARLEWYVQDLITAAEHTLYGQELLSRAVLVDSHSPIDIDLLMKYLNYHEDILIGMTNKQFDDLFISGRLTHLITNSIWINIAGSLIACPRMFDRLWRQSLSQLTAEHKQCLVLEICEDTISSDDSSVERIAFLQKQGFRVAMDDFGSGQSNLIQLSQCNFDIIKLDLKLIQNVPTDLWATSLYREVISLSTSKGCIIVAEGIETQAQSDFVRWAGVDILQGFLYSKPRPILSQLVGNT
jgi:EAL domain-containing protein (putative c-di-GMP-specific phosphodiesterase class I)|tara:strand:+ start:13933 stop:14679 length:747 start_codon:yes stop_codon:yes gene_type:complete